MLRRTIGQRGALRHILFAAGVATWAATLTAVFIWLPYPQAPLIPLVVLIATFEAIRPLHFGAERIGRYLQVFYEEVGDAERTLRDTPAWERVALRFGSVPGVGGHPLFLPVFLIATGVNLAVAQHPRRGLSDYIILTAMHIIFGAWLFRAHGAMKKQRHIELERMRQLHRSP